jgi:hypothetical protein
MATSGAVSTRIIGSDDGESCESRPRRVSIVDIIGSRCEIRRTGKVMSPAKASAYFRRQAISVIASIHAQAFERDGIERTAPIVGRGQFRTASNFDSRGGSFSEGGRSSACRHPQRTWDVASGSGGRTPAPQ